MKASLYGYGMVCMGFSDKKMASSVAMVRPLDLCYEFMINIIYKIEKDWTVGVMGWCKSTYF